MIKFTHLHVHSHYSLLDGLPKIDELLNYVKKSGMESVALTDHGVLYGAVEFYKKAKAMGIKPIIGAELYLAFEGMDQERPGIDDKKYHIVLLAKNEEGYKNLVKLITKAHLEGFYYKPRIDEALLSQHSSGLIGMTACVQGKIPRLIIAKKMKEAEELAIKYQEIFGEGNFYLEIQHHPKIPEQQKVNEALISFSKKLGIPLVATCDAHYLRPEDAEAQDVLMLINTGSDLNDPERLSMKDEDFSMKTPQEMIEAFKDVPEAIENTQKIAEECNFEFELGKTHLPYFPLPQDKNTDDYIKELCYQKLAKRYPLSLQGGQKEIIARLEYELSVIRQTGFASYFLIVQDFVNWAKDNHIVVGPGRGCFLPNTKILLSDGSQKNIEEIEGGETVITHLGNERRINKVLSYEIDEQITIVKSKMPAFELKLTNDHKILAARHKMCPVKSIKGTICKPSCIRSCRKKLWKDYKLQWIGAKDLRKNDLLVYPCHKRPAKKKIIFDLLNFDLGRNIKGDNKYVWYEIGTNKIIQIKTHRYIELNKKLATFLGFYVAEGWSRTRPGECAIGFGFNINEQEYAEEIKNLFKEIFGLEASIIEHKFRNSIQVYAYSLIVGKFLEKLCGRGALNKRIPKEIFANSREMIISFLTTLFKGDGSRKDTMRISFDSISYNLVSQVKMLLSQSGIMSSIKFRRHKARRWNMNYKLTISGKQLFRFNQLFPEFTIPIRKQKFYRNDTFISEDYIWFPVQKIESQHYKGKVFDLSVGKDTSYVANDVAVHNSAAGSIVSYILNITNVDPIKYNLLFERFLNPERVSMPDIDLDFADRRRDEVIEYVAQKYGRDKVAQIITFGTMAARAVVRDVGRALGYAYGYCDQLAKMIPFGFTLEQTLKTIDEFRQLYEGDAQARKLIDLAKKLEGVARHASTHACGVVISKEPLENIVALQHPTQNDQNIVTQYEMHAIEDLGLLKMDFLGLKNLTIIEDTLARIYKIYNKSINIDEIPQGDEKVFKLLQKADTVGIFQLESGGMRRYLKQLKPTEFEDIIAMVALYRPGPMELIPDYIARKHGKKAIEYLHPKLEPILKNTYAIPVYQEQIMQIARELACFSMGEADVLRKAIGKKIEKLLMEQKDKFIEGCVKNQIDRIVAQKIWAWVEPNANYSFNRSHAASYATIAYQTAWLKAHYPVEFMSAVLTSEKADVERISVLIEECKKMGIEVLPPDVNESFINFSVVAGKNQIRFGLLAIKNAGEKVVEAILGERKIGGPYLSIDDFVSRINSKDLNKKSFESMIKAGVFDKFGERNQLLQNMEVLLEKSRQIQKEKANGQKGLFDLAMAGQPAFTVKLTAVPPVPDSEKLKWEKELLGLYISGHPLKNYRKIMEKKCLPIADISHDLTGRVVKLGGVISGIKKIITKKGQPMLFVNLEDESSRIELVVFPSILENYPAIFQENKIVFVSGKVDMRDNVPKIICNTVEEIVEA